MVLPGRRSKLWFRADPLVRTCVCVHVLSPIWAGFFGHTPPAQGGDRAGPGVAAVPSCKYRNDCTIVAFVHRRMAYTVGLTASRCLDRLLKAVCGVAVMPFSSFVGDSGALGICALSGVFF